MTKSSRVGRIFMLLVLFLIPQTVIAAPAPTTWLSTHTHFAPDWLSANSASQFALGFPVLLPDSVPAPFQGEPSISVSSGYYSVYWLIPGTPPTYLQITGEVGGTIPDFSYYDRNNQLFINATVRGYDAYHDLTPVYDRVYWQEGNVVYTVDSQNLAATDSLTLANNLAPLVVDSPASTEDSTLDTSSGETTTAPVDTNVASTVSLSAPVTVPANSTANIIIGGVSDATLSADAGVFVDSGTSTLANVGTSTIPWQAPTTSTDLSVLFILADPTTGEWLATTRTTVLSASGSSSTDRSTANSDTTATSSSATTTDPTTESLQGATTQPSHQSGTSSASVGDGTGLGRVGFSTGGAADGTNNNLRAPNAPTQAISTVQPDQHIQSGDASGLDSGTTTSPRSTPATGTIADSATSPIPATPTTRPTPAVAPTATLAPSSGPNGMVAKVIGPDGGTLNSPAGANLTIPPGALKEDATVTIAPVIDSKLPVITGVQFIPDSAFDITVAAPTGNSISQLEKPATITISLRADQWRTGMLMYWIDGMEPKALDNSELSETEITAHTDHFSRFAVGLPTAVPSSERNVVPFLLGAFGVMVLLLFTVGFITAQHHRRPRTIPTRRNRYRS